MRLIVLVTLALGACPAIANAHGGGLDANGCHHDRKRGGYHCHRAPAVQYVVPQTVSPSPSVPTTTSPLGNSLVPATPAKSTLYRCVGADGIPFYTSKRPAGVVCKGMDYTRPQLAVPPPQPVAGQLAEAGQPKTLGSTWQDLGTLGDGSHWYFSPSSIKRIGASSRGWILFDLAKPRIVGKGKALSVAERWTIWCEDERYGKSDVVYYSAKGAGGEAITSWSGQPEFQSAVPGSVAADVVQLFCARLAE